MPLRDYQTNVRPDAEREVVGQFRDGIRLYEVALVANGVRVTQKTDYASHYVQFEPARAGELANLILQAAERRAK